MYGLEILLSAARWPVTSRGFTVDENFERTMYSGEENIVLRQEQQREPLKQLLTSTNHPF
jgi:hypothetical protein